MATAGETAGIIAQIIDYESGQMSEEEIIAFYQRLVDTGLAWTLQGHYGRMAQILIDNGVVEF